MTFVQGLLKYPYKVPTHICSVLLHTPLKHHMFLHMPLQHSYKYPYTGLPKHPSSTPIRRYKRSPKVSPSLCGRNLQLESVALKFAGSHKSVFKSCSFKLYRHNGPNLGFMDGSRACMRVYGSFQRPVMVYGCFQSPCEGLWMVPEPGDGLWMFPEPL